MLKEATVGVILGLVGLLGLARCGAARDQVECQLRAVSALPLNEPETITVGEARALGLRLKACQATGDGGAR